MFIAAVVGSFAGLVWPLLVRYWQKAAGGLFRYGVGDRLTGVAKFLLLVAIVLGVIRAALRFVAFLGDAENRRQLQELGSLAYFSTGTYGFACSNSDLSITIIPIHAMPPHRSAFIVFN